MKLTKAIEILEHMAQAPDWVFDTNNRDALKLGIEALKRERDFRIDKILEPCDFFPSETED